MVYCDSSSCGSCVLAKSASPICFWVTVTHMGSFSAASFFESYHAEFPFTSSRASSLPAGGRVCGCWQPQACQESTTRGVSLLDLAGLGHGAPLAKRGTQRENSAPGGLHCMIDRRAQTVRNFSVVLHRSVSKSQTSRKDWASILQTTGMEHTRVVNADRDMFLLGFRCDRTDRGRGGHVRHHFNGNVSSSLERRTS